MKRVALAPLLLALAASAATAASPATGPGSAAWTADLAAIQAALDSGSPQLDATVKAFGQKHRLKETLFRLRRAAGLYPVMTSGRSDPKDPMNQQARYRLASIATTPFFLEEYGEKLGKLLPKVESGRKTLEWARKKAAKKFVMMQLFRHVVGLEIADIPSKTGVMISHPSLDDRSLEIFRLKTWKPDSYKTFKSTWEDLYTRIVLSPEYDVVQVDQEEPAEGYRSLIEALTRIGELAPVDPEAPPAAD